MKVRRSLGLTAMTAVSLASVVAFTLVAPARAASITINVAMVGNPQMLDLQKLTAANFTATTGINVNYTILPENQLRDKVTQDVTSGTGAYDVVTLGMFDATTLPSGTLKPLESAMNADTAWNKADVFPGILHGLTGSDGHTYAAPFYGESSFLMYRKDLAAKAHVTMPLHPTWDQVAAAAVKMNDPKNGVSGICLRGQEGWGEQFAPLTTVVNAFGGTWFDKNWVPQVNSSAFLKAVTFYVNLLKKAGEPAASQAGFTECDNALSQGKTAMWYDATSATSSIESPTFSKEAGKFGYAYAPTEVVKKPSGWLWAWGFAEEATSKQDAADWKFISWATSSQYENLVGKTLGWTRVPDAKRASTYANPDYTKAAAAYYKVVLGSLQGANPNNPGAQARPTAGVQFVAVPEFANLGNACSLQVDKALTGGQTVSKALKACQALAVPVGKLYAH